jgi:endonuclease YncB( thermonuclease family)
MLRTATAIVLCLAVAAPTVPAFSAEGSGAATGQSPVVQQARVTRVADGDTVYVRGGRVPVRLIGIDAPDKGTGDCLRLAATRELKRLLRPSRRVRLSASRADSTSIGNGMRRPLRYVERGGVDLSAALLRRGLAVFNAAATEHAREVRHARAAQWAAHRRIGLWQADACGAGPDASLRIFVNYNADGSDKDNVGGKYIRIVNDGAPASLAGWRLRLGNRKYLPLPDLQIGTGRSLVVHNGSGAPYFDGDHHVFWGARISLPDPRNSANDAGAVYLQDPQRNYRAWSIWPCVVDCTSISAESRLSVKAVVRPEEGDRAQRFEIINQSDTPVDASFLVLEVGVRVHELPQGSVVAPGEPLPIWAHGTGDGQSLGLAAGALPRRGGSALLRGHDGRVVDTVRW